MEVDTLKNDLLPAIEGWRAVGEEVAVATVVRVVGTAPRREGSKLAVSSSGEIAGSVSGGCVEGAVTEEALRVLRTGKPALLQYGITADMITDVGLSCGGEISVFVEPLANIAETFGQLSEYIKANKSAAMGTVVSGDRMGANILVSGDKQAGGIHPDLDIRVASDARELLVSESSEVRTYRLGDEQVEVFIETFPPPQRLVIVGAVHVAIPLHRLAKMLGYHVTVVDARGILATPERFPSADSILVEWPDDAMNQMGLDSGTSVVVLTHDPKFDHPALLTALRSDARYIGAIGSRTTNENRMAALSDEGFTDEQLARIFAPVGLDIGAQTPAEIALSIMSEIVAARYGREGGHKREAVGSKQEAVGSKQEAGFS